MATNNSINIPIPISVANGGTGATSLTSHSVLVGNGTSAITQLTVGTNGQVLLGATGANPAFATLTSTGGTVTFTTGANTLNLESAVSGANSFPTDSGTATQSGGSLTIAGSTNINTTGASATVTINLNGSISLSNTNSSGTTGLYSLGGNRFMHNFGTDNTFLGTTAGNLTLTGTDCTAIGYLAGNALTSSSGLTAVGSQSFPLAAGGSGNNTGLGYASGFVVSTGDSNTLIGAFAGSGITTGASNTCLGFQAGGNYTSSESSNIIIRNTGTVAESNTIRIGTQGSGAGQQNRCFIAGIAGVTVSNNATVLINTTTGQLGTVASSIRYKENVIDMENFSEDLYKLRPVIFNYKSDHIKEKYIGLIAEEVHQSMPFLVNYDLEGLPDSVRYHDLPVLLLNEIQKLNNKITRYEAILAQENKGVDNGN